MMLLTVKALRKSRDCIQVQVTTRMMSPLFFFPLPCVQGEIFMTLSPVLCGRAGQSGSERSEWTVVGVSLPVPHLLFVPRASQPPSYQQGRRHGPYFCRGGNWISAWVGEMPQATVLVRACQERRPGSCRLPRARSLMHLGWGGRKGREGHCKGLPMSAHPAVKTPQDQTAGRGSPLSLS